MEFSQGTVARLLVTHGRVDGVETLNGNSYKSKAVVLTAGTFLRGRIHQGLETQIPAGRAGEAPATEVAQSLEDAGLTVKRFKTGTPPRIDGRTVDYGRVQRQDGDPGEYWFSYYIHPARLAQRPCYLTYTDGRLREIVSRNLGESALYGGAISGRGPRYCPSIEDKILKFPTAERHQVFLEPEGLDTSEMYVNGLSTSLPPQIQFEFLRTVPGLEKVRMTRAGYAIEYDYYPPTQLKPTLESKVIPGLFLAGQVNGTTGYEEAAGQGVVAGLNAAGAALNLEQVVFGRNQAFLGVLTDDLVNRGVDEPYRLFTSRSEYRLLLRQDNALRRLFPIADEMSLLTSEERSLAESRLLVEDGVKSIAESMVIEPDEANPILLGHGSSAISQPRRLAHLARRPEVPLLDLLKAAGFVSSNGSHEWADIELKYAGYLAKEKSAAARLAELDEFGIPAQLEYGALSTLSFEAREKLAHIRPESLGQASRIPGVSPSDLQSLVFEVLKYRRKTDPGVSRETANP